MHKKSSPSSHLLRTFQELLRGDAQSGQAMMLRYFIVAGIATVCDYSLNVLCYTLLSDQATQISAAWITALSVAIAFLFGVWVNYVLSVKWAFRGAQSGKSRRDQIIFVVTAILGLGINIGVVSLLEQWANLDPRIGRIPAILIAFAWNFYSKKWWVFKS